MLDIASESKRITECGCGDMAYIKFLITCSDHKLNKIETSLLCSYVVYYLSDEQDFIFIQNIESRM